MFLQLRRSGYQLGNCFTLLGVMDGLEERGGLDPTILRRGRPLFCRLKGRLALKLFVWWKDYFGRTLWKKYPDRPGWNDYWMAIWFMTGNPEHAHEIYTRATAIPGPGVDAEKFGTAATARWMVASVRGQHPDFDAQVSTLEAHYGVPVVSLLPPSPDYRPQPPGACSHCGCVVGVEAEFEGPPCNCACHAQFPAAAAERDRAS